MIRLIDHSNNGDGTPFPGPNPFALKQSYDPWSSPHVKASKNATPVGTKSGGETGRLRDQTTTYAKRNGLERKLASYFVCKLSRKFREGVLIEY